MLIISLTKHAGRDSPVTPWKILRLKFTYKSSPIFGKEHASEPNLNLQGIMEPMLILRGVISQVSWLNISTLPKIKETPRLGEKLCHPLGSFLPSQDTCEVQMALEVQMVQDRFTNVPNSAKRSRKRTMILGERRRILCTNAQQFNTRYLFLYILFAA